LKPAPVNRWLCLDVEIPAQGRDCLADLLWQLNTVGFSEQEQKGVLKVRAFFSPKEFDSPLATRITEHLDSVGIMPGRCATSTYEFEAEEWLEQYRASFQEFTIGESFFIYPPWRSPSARHPVNIVMEPTFAFGTGTHESTQLAMLALEPILPHVRTMLDVGTGSGILTIAARKLKQDLQVTAFDIDELSVRAAEVNLTANQVDDVRLYAGETKALRATYELVVANLTLELFSQLAEELIRLGSEHLVLSGFTSEQSETVLLLFQGVSPFHVVDKRSENEWVCFHLEYEMSSD